VPYQWPEIDNEWQVSHPIEVDAGVPVELGLRDKFGKEQTNYVGALDVEVSVYGPDGHYQSAVRILGDDFSNVEYPTDFNDAYVDYMPGVYTVVFTEMYGERRHIACTGFLAKP